LISELKLRIFNVGLRGLSMGARFFLIVALAKLLEPAEVGLFGLMLVSLAFGVLLIGADFYTYAHRQLLAVSADKWSAIIQHQLVAQLILYTLLFPFILLIFIFGYIDWEYIYWFFALLVVEHWAQELNRLLTVMQQQIKASLVLFLRQASWIFIIIPLFIWQPELRSLENLYLAWLVGAMLAVLVGILFLARTLTLWEKIKIDWGWIKKGLKVGGGFLLASLCFKGLLTFDRYALESLGNPEMLGAYALYMGIILGAYNFLDPAIFAFLYPKMLKSFQAEQSVEYSRAYKELTWTTVFAVLIILLLFWNIMPLIIEWLDKPIYLNYLFEFRMLLIAGMIYSVAYIPHYALYAMKGDSWIISSHIISLILFLILVFVIDSSSAIRSVAFSLLIAMSCMAVIKMTGSIINKRKLAPVNGVLYK